MLQRFSHTRVLVVIAAILLPLQGCAEDLSSSAEVKVRPSAVAGSWYTADGELLRTVIDKMLLESPEASLENPQGIRALIVPHAGYQFSGLTAAAGFKLLQGRQFSRVIVLGPAHYSRGYRGLSIPEVTHYETPLGRIPLDQRAIAQLRKDPLVANRSELHQREHSIEMELPFLHRTLVPGWKLVPVLVASMNAEQYAEAGRLIRPLADENTLIVVSGDFTHYGPRYGYLPFPLDSAIEDRLSKLDMGAFKNIVARDAESFMDYREKTGISACAFGPIMVLLEMVPDSTASTLLHYATSGELTGDFTNSVSYLTVALTDTRPFSALRQTAESPSAAVDQPEPTSTDMQYLHHLAELSLKVSVARDQEAERELKQMAAQAPKALRRNGAAFVTLRKNGALRGCIGTTVPQEPLYRSIMRHTANAALFDHRFNAVQASEIEELDVEVSVLSAPHPIKSYRDIELGKHGVILRKNDRRALFLPEVAVMQGWGLEQTLTSLSKKAGLPGDAWKNGAELQVFTTQGYPH